MREILDNARYAPTVGRYKVYLIDEVHMLSKQAFNALLKTIEEPPPWVVFVLCTTESHKIPVTIASRCQQFSFRSVEFTELMSRMQWICEQEGIIEGEDRKLLQSIVDFGDTLVREVMTPRPRVVAIQHGRAIFNLAASFHIDEPGPDHQYPMPEVPPTTTAVRPARGAVIPGGRA